MDTSWLIKMATVQDSLDTIEAGDNYVVGSMHQKSGDNASAVYHWYELGPSGEIIEFARYFAYTWNTSYGIEGQTVTTEKILISDSGEDEVMTAEAIRDTNDHYSSVSDNRGFVPKTVYVENDLDVDVLICVGGSRHSDFTTGVPSCGGEQTITAGETDYLTLTDYFPYMKIKVRCASAPTTGDVTVTILRVKA